MVKVQVGVVMGSQSDWATMRHAAEMLDALGVVHEVRIISAHRTPDRMMQYAHDAAGRGLKVIIAGAGGAAHLPGMLASKTRLPVLGVPVQSKALSGLDSLQTLEVSQCHLLTNLHVLSGLANLRSLNRTCNRDYKNQNKKQIHPLHDTTFRCYF